MSNQPIYIGHRTDFGRHDLFGLTPADARFHTYVIGKTGSGKTTLLRNLILQHLYRGHGVGLIDPHGDLAEELLDNFPSWRTDDLVYFNPTDLDFPVSLNLLANIPPDDRPLVASGLVEAFKSLWRDSWGPRMEYILFNALSALLDCQNVSLLGVNRLLTEVDYRSWVIRQIKDPFIRQFWTDEFAGYDARFIREAIAPIQNKLGQFLLHPPIRNILGQVKRKIDFRFMLDRQRVFLANLSKGKLGADKANLLGSLLVTQFQLAAMSRANQPEAERTDFHLFIDEFHNFTTDSFATALAEARKYRLSLTLAHQYLDQLSPTIRSSVLGNAGTLLSFQVGAADAEVLAREFGDTYQPTQFADLDRFELFARPMEGGGTTVPFRARALAPLSEPRGRRHLLIQRSRERFSATRHQVEAILGSSLRSASGFS
jgi:hypothetical protein